MDIQYGGSMHMVTNLMTSCEVRWGYDPKNESFLLDKCYPYWLQRKQKEGIQSNTLHSPPPALYRGRGISCNMRPKIKIGGCSNFCDLLPQKDNQNYWLILGQHSSFLRANFCVDDNLINWRWLWKRPLRLRAYVISRERKPTR